MSDKTILIAGFGPGISNSVAERFGAEGFRVAMIARNEARLAGAAQALRDKGIDAVAFPADLSDAGDVRAIVADIRERVGPISVLHWNTYGMGGGDLTTSTDAELRTALEASTINLVAAVQAVLPDLVAAERGAVLVTNGALGLLDHESNAACVQWGAMGLGIANAAKQKLVGVLAERLKTDGVYVGEVVVAAVVKGSDFAQGQGTLDPADVADQFWGLFQERAVHSVIFPTA